MSDNSLCTVPANPDITGIGIRISIYCQAFLVMIIVFLVCVDRKVTSRQAKALATLHSTLMWTNYALLATSVVQMFLGGLDPFHSRLLLELYRICSAAILPLQVILFAAPSDEDLKLELPPLQVVSTLLFCILQAMFRWPIWTQILKRGQKHSSGGKDCEKVWFFRTLTERIIRLIFLPTYFSVLALVGLALLMHTVYTVRQWLQWARSPLSPLDAAPLRFGLRCPSKYYWIATRLIACVFYGLVVYYVDLIARQMHQNAKLLEPEENEWSFGQTLAIFMLSEPTWAVIQVIWYRWKEREGAVNPKVTVTDPGSLRPQRWYQPLGRRVVSIQSPPLALLGAQPPA